MNCVIMEAKQSLRMCLAIGCLAAAAVAQWLLGGLKFSNAKGEAVFRGLYALSYFANLMLLLLEWRRSRRATAAAPWPMVVPAGLTLAVLWLAIGGRDAQGAIWVLLLPILHFVLVGVSWAVLAARSHSGRTS
jgi:hypothetical protein